MISILFSNIITFYHLSSSTYLIAFDSYSFIEVYVAFEYRVRVSYITFDSEVQPHRIRLPANTESYVAFYHSLGLLTLMEHISKSSTLAGARGLLKALTVIQVNSVRFSMINSVSS